MVTTVSNYLDFTDLMLKLEELIDLRLLELKGFSDIFSVVRRSVTDEIHEGKPL